MVAEAWALDQPGLDDTPATCGNSIWQLVVAEVGLGSELEVTHIHFLHAMYFASPRVRRIDEEWEVGMHLGMVSTLPSLLA